MLWRSCAVRRPHAPPHQVARPLARAPGWSARSRVPCGGRSRCGRLVSWLTTTSGRRLADRRLQRRRVEDVADDRRRRRRRGSPRPAPRAASSRSPHGRPRPAAAPAACPIAPLAPATNTFIPHLPTAPRPRRFSLSDTRASQAEPRAPKAISERVAPAARLALRFARVEGVVDRVEAVPERPSQRIGARQAGRTTAIPIATPKASMKAPTSPT